MDIYAMKLFSKITYFLVYMYYTHPGYWTSIFGTNCTIIFESVWPISKVTYHVT